MIFSNDLNFFHIYINKLYKFAMKHATTAALKTKKGGDKKKMIRDGRAGITSSEDVETFLNLKMMTSSERAHDAPL